MKFVRIAGIAVSALGLLLGLFATGYYLYGEHIRNPRIERELIEHPDGERAGRVMLLTLPSERRIPVNYLQLGDRVYAAGDGTWWQDLVGDGFPVTVLIRGETLTGRARAILDDPDYTRRIFEQLRPNAIEGFGTLVEIRLGAGP